MKKTEQTPKDRIMVYKISKLAGGSYYCLIHSDNVMEDLESFVDYAEPGHQIHIEVEWMDRQTYHNLPEYEDLYNE